MAYEDTLITDATYGYAAYAIDQTDTPLATDQSTELGLTNDDQAVEINLGSNIFRFYDQDYSRLWVSSNGKIAFESSDTSYSNGALATTSNPSINVFWDDLFPNSVNTGFYSIQNDELVIDWQSIIHIGSSSSADTATFQAILGLNSGQEDGYIVLNYYDVTFGSSSYDYGASATIGVAGSSDYLQLSYESTDFLQQYDSVLISSSGLAENRQSLSSEASNTAPSTSDAELSVPEDSQYNFAVSDFSFTDADNGDSLKAILILSTPLSGQLFHNDSVVEVGESGYQIAAGEIESLKFIPDPNESGDPYSSFDFQVIDQSDALSSTAKISFVVEPVNDAPNTASVSRTVDEDSSYTFDSSDFGFSDPDDGDSLKGVLIVSSPTQGQLFFGDDPVHTSSDGYFIPVSELGNLIFVPGPDENGDDYSSFNFKVIDQSDAYSDQSVFTINVNPVNDPPVILVEAGSSVESDFSSTTDGWSHGSLVTSSEWGSFLGTFGAGQSTSKTFSESTPIQSISFDWLRLDSWDGEFFKIKANGNEIFSKSFSFNTNVTTTSSGSASGFTWVLTPHEYGGSYWGSTGWSDQRFTIVITPPEGTNELTLELSSTLDQAADDEAWGIDNVVVETQGSISTGTVTEAGSADDGAVIEGTSSVSGTLSATDVDAASTLNWSIEGSPSTTYGSISIDSSTGEWTYELDNSLDATQALSEGSSVEETFVARVTDDAGEYAEQAITITIIGSNDGPIIASNDSDHAGSVKEAGHSDVVTIDQGAPSASGTLIASDVDHNSLLTWSLVGSIDTTYGTFSIDSESGEWSYILDNSKTALQKLFTGDTRTLVYTARVTDQYDAYSDQTIEITINGTDDIVRQFADYVIDVSSEGQDDGSDRWLATQSLGAPNTDQYADLDTAWSPRHRNAAGDVQADEYISLGFNRPVKATGFVIHENYGSGFVRRVDAIDTDDQVHELWVGDDNSPSDLAAFSVSLDQPTDYLVKGLQIWVDTDHTSDWEQIDAVELIGWAAPETYLPLAPTLDLVAGDSVVNAQEKALGLVLTGKAEANSTIELSWGDVLHTALVGADRRWSLTIETQDIPEDADESLITLIAVDAEGYRSNPISKGVRINTAAPTTPQIDSVAGDNKINTYEKLTGVLVQGSAVGAVSVEINWDNSLFSADVTRDGQWSLVVGGTDGTGAVPADSINSEILVTAIDPDGNRSAQASHSVIIDTSAPSSPSLNDVAEDNIINAAEKSGGVILSGSSELGTTVTLQWGTATHTALTNEDGYWSLTLSSNDIPDDARRSRISLRATDPAGNQSNLNRQLVSIDTLAPEQPVINPLNSNDIINNDIYSQGVALTGRSERNSIVNISWNGHQFSTTATSSGRWSYLVARNLLPPDGSSTTIIASAIDAAGNQSGSTSRTVAVDLTAPNPPTVNSVGQSGFINASLKAQGITIGGTAEPGSAIYVGWAGLKKQVQTDSDGLWSLQITTEDIPRDGTSLLSLTAVDAAGNRSMQVTETVLVDTKPPRSPRFSGKVANDQVISAAERVSGVVLQGTTEAGSQLTVGFAGITKQAVVTGTRWEVILDTSEIPVADGLTQTITAIATDAVGNQSTATSVDVLLNTEPPAAPVINVVGINDQVNASNIIRGVSISGTADVDVDTVELTWGDYTQPVSVRRGRWSTIVRESDIPSDGLTTLFAVAVSDGVQSSESTRSVLVDSVDPASPVLNTVGAENVINSALHAGGLRLTGSARPGDRVSVLWEAGERTTQTDEDGNWFIDYTPFQIPGDNSNSPISLYAEDEVGNRSTKVSTSVLIDTSAPVAPTLNDITGDNIISISERSAGITLSGRAEKSSRVTITLGSYQASTDASQSGQWSHFINSTDLPSQGESAEFRISSTDSAGNTSIELVRTAALAYSAATAPLINAITSDDRINASEARSRLSITGSGEANSRIDFAIGSKTFNTVVNSNGLWTLQLRRNHLPAGDGEYAVTAASANDSGLQSSTSTRSLFLDRESPNIVLLAVAGSTIILEFSEEIADTNPDVTQFAVSAGRRSVPVQSVLLDQSGGSKLRLQLASAPSAESRLSLSYTPSSHSEPVADLAGNLAARFRNLQPQVFTATSDVPLLASGYSELYLAGASHLKAIANDGDNLVIGNDGDNIIEGRVGADTLTGRHGRDTFVLSRLRDSLLGTSNRPRFDHITDFSIGTDIIDGPSSVLRGQVNQLTEVADLNASTLSQHLSSQLFSANGAALFSYNDSTGERWFLALNDSTAGFSSTRDALIEITGFTGDLSNFQIL